MAVLRIQDFSGVIPVKGDRAIPDNFAVESVNTWLYGSELRGVRPPADIINVNAGTQKVMRIPKRTVGGDPAYPTEVPPPSYLGDSVWVLFTDPDTDIVKGQLVEDSFQRWYFCSPSTGPMFNTYARLLAGQSMYKLGVVPPPQTGPYTPTITSITGGATPITSRSYLYTWINEFGEESAPSLPVLGSGNHNANWTIGNIADPPAQPGYPNYQKKRLYRTLTGASGQTTFYMVADIPIGTTAYTDVTATTSDTWLAGQLVLESTSWQPAPTTLKGFIAMPNGFLIGFDGSDLHFSESYRFHAWPPEYKQATETPIVGLGVHGTTCVVCTQGYPATASGVEPASVAFTKATTGEPAMSRGSIVSTPDGVIYASQNGLMLIGPAGMQNVTAVILTREEWLRDFAPAYIRACRYQNGYLALRDLPTGGGTPSGFFLDPTELKVALTEFTVFSNVVNVQADIWSGEVFLITNETPAKIKRWDAPSDELLPILWKSKEYQYPFQDNFGAYAIHWDPARYSDVPISPEVLPADEQVRFRVFADRQVVYDEEVPRNGRPVRLPSGFKAEIWQFEIRARAPVYSMHVANSIKELRGV